MKRGAQVVPVAEGMAIQQGDVLTTDRGSHLVVTLADQSKMQLGEGGTLAIDQAIVAAGSRNAVKVQLTSGRLRSLVSSALHGMSPNFQVRTANMVAGVRGTDFEVSYSEGQPRFGYGECTQFTDVGVYNGLVEVANASGVGGGVLVDEGYETTVACAAAPTSPGPLGLTGTVLAPVLPGSEAPPPIPAAGTPPPAAPPPPLPPPPQ